MNQEQAKAWLPLIQAVAEGKTIQTLKLGMNGISWGDCGLYLGYDEMARLDPKCFRIKPEQKKQTYRVALKRTDNIFYPIIAEQPHEEAVIQTGSNFVEWLTDRIEYTLPEEN